jgi:hypothetical protein
LLITAWRKLTGKQSEMRYLAGCPPGEFGEQWGIDSADLAADPRAVHF